MCVCVWGGGGGRVDVFVCVCKHWLTKGQYPPMLISAAVCVCLWGGGGGGGGCVFVCVQTLVDKGSMCTDAFICCCMCVCVWGGGGGYLCVCKHWLTKGQCAPMLLSAAVGVRGVSLCVCVCV